MPSTFSKKAQFFIMTTVTIVGVFYVLSKYMTPYSFIDTSKAVMGGEAFFLNNVKDKAIKTVEISDRGEVSDNLEVYKNFVQNLAGEKGYNLVFSYWNDTNTVYIDMTLTSPKYTLKSSFTVSMPPPPT